MISETTYLDYTGFCQFLEKNIIEFKKAMQLHNGFTKYM